MDKKKVLKKIKYALRFLPDSMYIQLYYFVKFKRFCNLKNPKTFNEKLNWLKLHDRNPLYTKLVDKYEVKQYVANIIGDEYIVPTLGVWDKFDDIDFDALPEQFVLKCTHDSGGQVIVKSKATLDKKTTKKIIETSLKMNFYYSGREWPYKDVTPRIIAETYLKDSVNGELRDYKFYSFDGSAKIFCIISGRRGHNMNFDFYDMQFNHLDIVQCYPNADKLLQKPKTFDKMIEFSERLSKEIPHVRVDFYEANEKLFFGELTFSDAAGFFPFTPEKWDRILGDWLILPEPKKIK